MPPTITAFQKTHQLPNATVVADAGMKSEANRIAIETAGLSFILGTPEFGRPLSCTAVAEYLPGMGIPDGHVFSRRIPRGPKAHLRSR